MGKLGYTFYPKDWGSSDSVFELTLAERGLYRELIDMAMLNDNKTVLKESVWCRKFNTTKEELNQMLDKFLELNLIQIKGDKVFIPSCENRLKLKRAGQKGGLKKKPIPKQNTKPLSKPNSKPIPKQNANQSKRESKREKESKSKIEVRKKEFSDTLKPFLETYGKDMLNDFYAYWTEPNKSNTKFRQELEKTWSLKRRLDTWAKRDRNFNKASPITPTEKQLQKQDLIDNF